MRDVSRNTKATQALAPALRTASATGATVDRLGHETVTFLVSAGARTDGTHTVVLEDSADGTTWAAVPGSNLVGTPPAIAAAGDANKATMLGYIGDARYLRAKVNVTGSPATGAIVGITALLGSAHQRPVAA